MLCSAAAVSRARSREIYLSSGERAALGLVSSMAPLHLAWEQAISRGLCNPSPIQEIARIEQRVAEHRKLSRARLAAMLREQGDQFKQGHLSEDELIMRLLAISNDWVDLSAGQAVA